MLCQALSLIFDFLIRAKWETILLLIFIIPYGYTNNSQHLKRKYSSQLQNYNTHAKTQRLNQQKKKHGKKVFIDKTRKQAQQKRKDVLKKYIQKRKHHYNHNIQNSKKKSQKFFEEHLSSPKKITRRRLKKEFLSQKKLKEKVKKKYTTPNILKELTPTTE